MQAGDTSEILVNAIYQRYSFQPRKKVDLSVYTPLIGGKQGDVDELIAAHLSEECVQLILKGLPALGCAKDYRRLLKRCIRLRELNVSDATNLSKAAFVAIAQQCPHIDTLVLSDLDYLTDSLVKKILTSFHNLHSIDIGGCDALTDAAIKVITTNVVFLRSIRVDDCYRVSDRSMKPMMETHGHNLRLVSFRRCVKVTNATLRQLLATKPKELIELNAAGCTSLSDEATEFLTTVPAYFGERKLPGYENLRRIDISGCYKFTSLTCSWIAAACPLLLCLNIFGCTGICDKGVKAIACLQYLEDLDISGCVNLTVSGLMHLFSAAPTTSYLHESQTVSRQPFVRLAMQNVQSLSDPHVLAIIGSSSKQLCYLDISFTSAISPATLAQLVRVCKNVEELYLRRQPGVNRMVMAMLATNNFKLQVLDLRECIGVDDLALYPLLVMRSLRKLYLSGCSKISAKGMKTLPPTLTELHLQYLPQNVVTDYVCETIGPRCRMLEVLDLSYCCGISTTGVRKILQCCQYLYSLNIYDCKTITIEQLDQILQKDERVRYGVEVLHDEEMKYFGFHSSDPQVAMKARAREKELAAYRRLNAAATWIQNFYQSYRRRLATTKDRKQREWNEFCAVIDIQRTWRGYYARRAYTVHKQKFVNFVVKLQRLWRRIIESRKIRRAIGFWTNRILMIRFIQWKAAFQRLQMERIRAKNHLHSVKALQFFTERRAGPIFYAWRKHILREREVKSKVLNFLRYKSLPKVLSAWRELLAYDKERQWKLSVVFLNVADLETYNSSVQRPLVDRSYNAVKKLVWRRWKQFASVQKSFVMKAAFSIISGSLLHWGFRQWNQNAKRKKHLREKTKKIARRLVHRDILCVWNGWRDYIERKKAMKRALALLSNSIVNKTWFAWKREHEHTVALRQISGKLIGRLLNGNLSRAVASWYDFTQEQLVLRQRLRQVVALMTNGTLVRTFYAFVQHRQEMQLFRRRMRARMENADLFYRWTRWVKYTRDCQLVYRSASVLQAFWRGTRARRDVEDWFLKRLWAVVKVQKAWRGRLGRMLLLAATRKSRLKEYIRAERERDALLHEEQLMRQFNRDIEMIVLLQRQWRGVAARTLYFEVRRARVIKKKQEERELQELVRAEAMRRKMNRVYRQKLMELSAITIQRFMRGYLARLWYRGQQEAIVERRTAIFLQAVYRGRISRRKTAALRRSYVTRMEMLARRAVEGKVLRTMGATTRPTQRRLRRFLNFFGLDPATFLTDIQLVFQEVREDFQRLRLFFDIVKAKVNANAEKQAQLTLGTSVERVHPLTSRSSLNSFRGKSDATKKFISDLDKIVATTQKEQKKEERAVAVGDAVRIVFQGHSRCGETGCVLQMKDGVGEVKMDVDGALEFIPLMIPATKVEPEKPVLHRVPDMTFTAVSLKRIDGHISLQWREELIAYAETIAEESKRYCAARVIQCAARTYLSRVAYQEELEKQGVYAARRQRALLKILQAFGGDNNRITNILEQLYFVRPLNIPRGLLDEPLEIQKIINRFQRFLARQKEIYNAFMRLSPDMYQGSGEFYGQMMPIPFQKVIDRILFYPLRWMARVTRVPAATFAEKRGMAMLAHFLGGAEFVKTFEEKHVLAHSHLFIQLKQCHFCASEGWAMVHGVFVKRKLKLSADGTPLPPDILQDDNENGKKKLKKIKKRTRRVPHGWGVAHFLSGQVGAGVSWLAKNSIEAQFKSLQLMKRLKQQEKEERLRQQILLRQGTLNEKRSKEGPRGFAKRHAELSFLEEQLKDLYARLIKERDRCDAEERSIYNHEKEMNAKIETQKIELMRQGKELSELQQQPPDIVAEVFMIESPKSPLEFLIPGCRFEVEMDDGDWYECDLLSIDPYVDCIAEIKFVVDGQIEKIKLIEEKESDDTASEVEKPRQSVREIKAAAAARARMKLIPFRKWRAGSAVDVEWEEPVDNGASILRYIVEWKDEEDEAVHGSSVIGLPFDNVVDDTKPTIPKSTTLWPIASSQATSLRVRVAAENMKGRGGAGLYLPLPELMTEVSYRTAVRLPTPKVDTSEDEALETAAMEREDTLSQNFRRQLTCTICKLNFGDNESVYEHIAYAHTVPLTCPFKSCQQICSSEQAFRYHLWKCTVPKPTPEELQSEIFMEIFSISKQYCFRKPRRHALPSNSPLHERGGEDLYLEGKFKEARIAWIQLAEEIHDRCLLYDRVQRERERDNRFVPPEEMFGIDFTAPDVNVARRNDVVRARENLEEELEAYTLETNAKLDQLRHEEKELQEYIALKTKRLKATEEEWQKQSLKREKKKAMKKLAGIQEDISLLVKVSTERIYEMKEEIERLTTIEKAFVPFTHQVVRLMQLSDTLRKAHERTNTILQAHRALLDYYHEDLKNMMNRSDHEVQGLEAWDAMVQARREQLQALQEEMRRMQLIHRAELEGLCHKRDEGDEKFQLYRLRMHQDKFTGRKERAMQELLSKKIGRKMAKGHAKEEDSDVPEPFHNALESVQIANHDLVLHEKFIQGKDAEADYLKDEANLSARLSVTNEEDSSSEQVNDLTIQEEADVVAEATLVETQDPLTSEEDGVIVRGVDMKRRNVDELPHTYRRLECSFVDGFIYGDVRIEFNDGSVYEGPWVNDASYHQQYATEQPIVSDNHWGKFTYHGDGSVWEGEDVDNFFSPFVANGHHFQVTTSEGHQYEGGVRNGLFHGTGTLHMNFTFSQGEYIGEWVNGKREGYGIEQYDGGEVYEGDWHNDLRHGTGSMIYDDGSKYEGHFEYNLWHGDGIRTLANGDKISGCFANGYLNGSGFLEYADRKSSYRGEFRNTLRHGFGLLIFANRDRYEGPFVDGEMHGEGKYTTYIKEEETIAGLGEQIDRMGKWVNGERVAWLSNPSTRAATNTFINYFATQRTVEGEQEMDLQIPKFKTPYAVMVASMLPSLPEGVDGGNAFVQTIVQMLAKSQNVVIGSNLLETSIEEHSSVQRELNDEVEALDAYQNTMEESERHLRAERRSMQVAEGELEKAIAREQELQIKVETFWKKDTNGLEKEYKRAVAMLQKTDVMYFHRLRSARLDAACTSLLDAFCILLNFTSNFYLNGQFYQPTREDVVKMLSNSDENVALGDKEGLIHRYNVKALYVLPLFDIYSFSEGTRKDMLFSLTPVIHHPRLRPNNAKIYQISPALTAICVWVRAAYYYAKKATEIYPVVQRSLDIIHVLDRQREVVQEAKAAFVDAKLHQRAVRDEVEMREEKIKELRARERRLAKVVQDIEMLDAIEQKRLHKKHIKLPSPVRPVSASFRRDAGNDSEDGGALQSINHRQAFSETHDPEEELKKQERKVKEDIMESIVADDEVAQEFDQLKREITKVLDRGGGKVPMDDVPALFEEVMLKPLDPKYYGVKKLRTLLELLEDVCTIVPPRREGDTETLEYPLASEDDNGNGPKCPRNSFYCRFCPGVSYDTRQELQIHERSKWHYWNMQAKKKGNEPRKWTLASTFWTEAFDSVSGELCYYNKLTGEILQSDDPPPEMEGEDVMMDLLEDDEPKEREQDLIDEFQVAEETMDETVQSGNGSIDSLTHELMDENATKDGNVVQITKSEYP